MPERLNPDLDPKDVASLQETCTSLFNLYSSTFGSGRRVDMIVLPPIEASRIWLGDNIDMSVPRGRYNLVVGIEDPTGKKIVAGVQFVRDMIHLVKGDPSTVDPENPNDVFRPILAHELVHSQVTPRAVVGVEPAPLLPRDIRFGGDIHYVLGFKAVSRNLRTNSTLNPTKPLDEYITQYLAMTMTNAFEERNPVLEKMKTHGLGINAEYIVGAEILHSAFSKYGITPQMVESFHSKSDIRGFLAMLRKINPELANNVLRAGIDANPATSINRLKEIAEDIP